MRFVFALLLATFAYANPIVFSPPTTLSSPTANASEIQVGADLSGNFVAVWIEDGVVKGATRPDGGSWSMPVSVSTAGATSLQLTVDAGGNATAIWVDAGDIKASSLPFGGNWSNETTLSLLASSAPSIESDPSGNVIAVWVEAGAVKSKTKLAGMEWPDLSDTLAASGISPQVALGPSGGAAVWQGVLNAIDAIYVARKTIGGAWSAPIAISNAQQNSKYPKIAIDPAGNMLAAWFRYSLSGGVYSNVIVQAAYGSASGTWVEPADLSQPGLRDPKDLPLSALFNGYGIGLLMWANSPYGSTFNAEAAVLGGGSWTTLPLVTANLYAFANAFSVDVSGYAFGSYMLLNPTTGNIEIQADQANTYSALVNISPLQTVSTGSPNGYPRIASSFVGGVSKIALLWLKYDGMYSVVQSSIGTSSQQMAPPSNLAVVQTSAAFGLFTDYVNTLSWTPSPDPTVSGTIIFRNGQQIGSTPNFVATFVDHNQAQNGPVTYSVSFFLYSGDMSAPATVSLP